MNDIWMPYKTLLGSDVVDQLFQIASFLKGAKIVHVNSTRQGGGVAEILSKMVPLMAGLGLDIRWEVIEGDEQFFKCTKMFHNIFQGIGKSMPSSSLLNNYIETNKINREKLNVLNDADFVFIHDPQPLSIIQYFPERKGKWIWRCHIDTSSSPRMIWKYFHPFLEGFNASIFSLDNFTHHISHPM